MKIQNLLYYDCSYDRIVFLIVLEYLNNYSDKNHMPKLTDIIEFAQNKYDLYIDYRKLSSMLPFLEELSKLKLDCFPYSINGESTGKRKKYYLIK